MPFLAADVDATGHIADLCPYHGRDSSFRYARRTLLEPFHEVSLEWPGPLDKSLSEVRAYECLACSKTVLVHHRWSEYLTLEEGKPQATGRRLLESRVLVPRVDAPHLPEAVPPEVASLWHEAAVCSNAGAFRGAAACLRAAVEQIAKDHGITSGNVESKIDALAEQSGLDEEVATALHDTRLTANWSMHDGVSFSADEVADLSELVREAVEILYVQPARREAMAADRAQRRGGKTA